ncbi:hypothetical protein PoB_004011400 [Plakobranchus ocellatus]|uniref:Uncharacterized protein n=1 Tax=Plakobranchus ocellatus TaxID=259542 RepID=A0AAV4B0R8_9GAST|nr:hypothetical protein PoB_004011400 [Plakobranchus ocellatus]
MRQRIAHTLAVQKKVFPDPHLWVDKEGSMSPSQLLQFLLNFADVGYDTSSPSDVFELETLAVAKDAIFMGLWQLFACAFLTKRRVISHYPSQGWAVYQAHCDRIITPPNYDPNTHALHIK